MELTKYKLFGSERSGSKITRLLLIQSVFTGIFYGIFNISAHAVFLSRFDETGLARAYIFSGLTGLALTWLYSFLHSRLRFSLFSLTNLIFIFLVTVVLWWLVRSGPEPWMVYTFFIMLGPLFIIMVMGLRLNVEGLNKQLQSFKFSGHIDSALIVGLIIGSFSVPLFLNSGIGSHNMLFISAISVLVLILIQVGIINSRFVTPVKRSPLRKNPSLFNALRANRYIRLLLVFFALSVLVLFFIQYSFMALTRLRYPGEYEMARFLAYFEGSMMIIALVLNSFLFSAIIKRQGLELALSLTPLLIGLFTVVAIVLGLTGEISSAIPGSVIFFLILAFSRVISRSLNIAAGRPALLILGQTLEGDLRPKIKSAVDGALNEITVVTAGLLLSGLGALTFIRLIHFSWALMVLVVIWLVFALRLYNEYRRSIRKNIDERGSEMAGVAGRSDRKTFDSVASAGLFIDNNYFELLTNSEIHENISDKRLVIQQVINKAEKNLNPDMLPLLRQLASGKFDSNGLTGRLQSLVNNIEKGLERQGLGKRKDLVSTLEESDNRRMHLQAIMSQQVPPLVTDLMRLIRDEDPDIRRETLYIAGKFRIKELLPEVCECLGNHDISRDAYSVLRSYGEEALPVLSRRFSRSSGNIMVRRLITRLFAETGGDKAVEFLMPGLWSVHSFLKKEAVAGLIRCNFRADDQNRVRIHQEVINIIRSLTWNLSAGLVVKENNDYLLFEAIEKDSRWWTDLMFDILSLVYESNTLEEIKDNLEKDTVESVNYALEIIDVSVDEAIKQQLKALLDHVSPKNKLRNLSKYHQVDVPDYKTLVQDLINKDYNQIGIWTKVCALRRLYELPKPGETDFLVALLFGVNRILREEACRYLQDNYDDVYASCSYRLPKLYRDQLDELLKNHIREEELVYEKLKSLLRIFPGLPEKVLISLAEDLRLVDGREAAVLSQDADVMIWPAEYEGDDIGDKIHLNWHTAGLTFDAADMGGSQGSYYALYVRDMERFFFLESRYSMHMVNYIDRVILEKSLDY